jgi:hypothetical protein
MPNPGILGPRGADLRPPDVPALLWNVYRLRDRGDKLDRAEILRTHRVGQLVIEPGEGGRAKLRDEGGRMLDALGEVRVRKLTPGGGLLLVGRERGPAGAAQAWWCVLKPRG